MLQNIFDKENVVDVDVSQMRLDTHTQCGVKGLSLTLKSKSVVEVMKNLRVENSPEIYSKTFTKLEDVLSINQPKQQKMFTCNTNRIAKLIPLDDQGQGNTALHSTRTLFTCYRQTIACHNLILVG